MVVELQNFNKTLNDSITRVNHFFSLYGFHNPLRGIIPELELVLSEYAGYTYRGSKKIYLNLGIALSGDEKLNQIVISHEIGHIISDFIGDNVHNTIFEELINSYIFYDDNIHSEYIDCMPLFGSFMYLLEYIGVAGQLIRYYYFDSSVHGEDIIEQIKFPSIIPPVILEQIFKILNILLEPTTSMDIVNANLVSLQTEINNLIAMFQQNGLLEIENTEQSEFGSSNLYGKIPSEVRSSLHLPVKEEVQPMVDEMKEQKYVYSDFVHCDEELKRERKPFDLVKKCA